MYAQVDPTCSMIMHCKPSVQRVLCIVLLNFAEHPRLPALLEISLPFP